MRPMRRAVQIARAVIGSPWTRVSGTVVGLIILAAIVNGSKNQNGAGVAPVEHSAGQQ